MNIYYSIRYVLLLVSFDHKILIGMLAKRFVVLARAQSNVNSILEGLGRYGVSSAFRKDACARVKLASGLHGSHKNYQSHWNALHSCSICTGDEKIKLRQKIDSEDESDNGDNASNALYRPKSIQKTVTR